MIREHQRAVRAGESAREIDHPNAIERSALAAGHRGEQLERVAVAENGITFDLLAVHDESGRLAFWDAERCDDLLRRSTRRGHFASLRAELLQLAVQEDADQPAVTDRQSTVDA